MAKVLVSCSNMGWLHQRLSNALPQWFLEALDRGHEITFATPVARPVTTSHNAMVERVLAEDFDYWLTIDDDTIPERNPLNWIELDKDAIASPTLCWNQSPCGTICGMVWNVFDKAGEQNEQALWSLRTTPGSGIEKVDHIGPACMLIARRVLEKIEPPKWEIRFDAKGLKVSNCDTFFSEKTLAAGFSTWADWTNVAAHYKEVDLLSIMLHVNKFFTSMARRPVTPEGDLEQVRAAMAASPPGNAVEIGCFSGESTAVLAQDCINQGRETLYAVDPWEPYYLTKDMEQTELLYRLRTRAYKQVVKTMKMKSGDAWSHMDDVAFVFVDGDHSTEATLNDVGNAWDILKEGGRLCVHDIDRESVTKALEQSGFPFERYEDHPGCGVAVGVKTS